MTRALYVSVCLATLALVGTTRPAISQTTTDPVVVISRHYPAPGREDELQARFVKIVEVVRAAEPKTIYRFYRSSKEPATFLFYEIYESQAARDYHMNVVAEFRKQSPPPEGLFARPSETEVYREITK